MRRLYLMRHAKSDWGNANLADFDRPLNRRGMKDAPEIGRRMKERGDVPDIIITSAAKRALTTAHLVANELGSIEVIENPGIYRAATGDMVDIIHNLPDDFTAIMLVGHNPAMSMLRTELGGHGAVHMPAAGLAKFVFTVDKWEEVKVGTLEHYDYPKNKR